MRILSFKLIKNMSEIINFKKCQHCGKSIGIHDDFCPFCQGNILIIGDNNESLIEIDKVPHKSCNNE